MARRGTILLVAVGIMVIATGCQPSTRPYEVSLEQEQRDRRAPMPLPIEPDRLRSGDVMAAADAFTVYPNTTFCGLGFMDPELRDAIAQQGYQSPGLNITGSVDFYPLPQGTLNNPGQARRTGYVSYEPESRSYLPRWEERCPNDNINLIFTQNLMMNGDGVPYRIVTTMRQGNRLLVRSFERQYEERSVLLGFNDLRNQLGGDSAELGRAIMTDLLGERP